MITEAVISAIVNGLLSIIGVLIHAVISKDTIPDYQFGVPSPLWFLVQAYTAQATLVYPIAFSWWLWRQVKG